MGAEGRTARKACCSHTRLAGVRHLEIEQDLLKFLVCSLGESPTILLSFLSVTLPDSNGSPSLTTIS